MSHFEKPAVVIDNGSYNIKAGFSCDNHPISIFRNVVGRPSYLNGRYGREDYDIYVGDYAIHHPEGLDLSSPIYNGDIVNWYNMERIWHHIFYRELRAAPDDRAVMLACAPSTPMSEKIKCCEVFFETLNCPTLCIQSQCVLALYGYGVTSGICIDMGHDNTNINPIYEGIQLSYAQIQTYLAGNQISNYIKKRLQDRKLYFGKQNEEIVEEIKRNCLFITGNCTMSREDCCKKFNLPDGKEINVSQEGFMAAEMIFQPNLVVGKECNYLPLHKAIKMATLKCDADIRSELYSAVILCGGSSMIPGFGSRLKSEIENISECPTTVLFSSEGYSAAWLGGSVFSTLPDAKQLWVSKSRYEEYGEKIVKTKF